MVVPLVPRRTAMARQTLHQHILGVGYIPHVAPPDLPPGSNGSKNCAPPAGTADGSLHVMKPSHGAPPMVMRWVASERAWASILPGKGIRMAFTTDYLMKAGWEYIGSAPAAPPKGKRKVS